MLLLGLKKKGEMCCCNKCMPCMGRGAIAAMARNTQVSKIAAEMTRQARAGERVTRGSDSSSKSDSMHRNSSKQVMGGK